MEYSSRTHVVLEMMSRLLFEPGSTSFYCHLISYIDNVIRYFTEPPVVYPRKMPLLLVSGYLPLCEVHLSHKFYRDIILWPLNTGQNNTIVFMASLSACGSVHTYACVSSSHYIELEIEMASLMCTFLHQLFCMIITIENGLWNLDIISFIKFY